MSRITLTLSEKEKLALRTLAQKEFRDPRQQAAMMIRKELERRGLLKDTDPPKQVEGGEQKITA